MQRPKIISSSISTTKFSRSYLERAWNDRNQLAEYERNGFAIFFYITVTGHVEATMVELMKRRLMYTRSVVSQHKDGDFSWGGQNDQPRYKTLPIYETLTSLVTNFVNQIERAPLNDLKKLFQDVFSVQLSGLLGDCYQDLDALAKLRNVFAHGRDFRVRFNQDDNNLMSPEGNPHEGPAKRLLAAKVITTLQPNDSTYPDFQRAFFSDNAMLYFLGRAKDIEKKLRTVLVFIPETQLPPMVSLPDLSL